MFEPRINLIPFSQCRSYDLHQVVNFGSNPDLTWENTTPGVPDSLAFDVDQRYAAILLRERGY